MVRIIIPYNTCLLAHTICGDVTADELVERFCVVRGFHIYKVFRDCVV